VIALTWPWQPAITISTDHRPGRDVVPESKLTPGGFDGKLLAKISIFQARFCLHLT